MTTNAKSCIGCGMPMRTRNDHCLGDVTKLFCTYCGGEDGTLKSYDEVLASMTAFFQRTQGIDEAAARQAAKATMAQLPAWSSR